MPNARRLSDRLGRRTMFFASCAFSALFAFPLFWLLDTRDPTTVILVIVIAITFGQMVGFGIGAPWYSELFSARLRYSGASLGFQVGAALSGVDFTASIFTPSLSRRSATFGYWNSTPIEPTKEVCCATMWSPASAVI